MVNGEFAGKLPFPRTWVDRKCISQLPVVYWGIMSSEYWSLLKKPQNSCLGLSFCKEVNR